MDVAMVRGLAGSRVRRRLAGRDSILCHLNQQDSSAQWQYSSVPLGH